MRIDREIDTSYLQLVTEVVFFERWRRSEVRKETFVLQ